MWGKSKFITLETMVYRIDQFNSGTKYLIKLHNAKKDDPEDETVFANIWVNKDTDVQSNIIEKYDIIYVEGNIDFKKSKGILFINISAYTIKLVKTKEEVSEMFRKIAEKKKPKLEDSEIATEELTSGAGDVGIPF